MNFGGAVSYAKEHPILVGGGALIIGFFAYTMLKGGGSSASSGGAASSDAAYYNAVAAQSTAGDALQSTMVQTQGATAQTALNDAAAVTIANGTNASQVTINASNNAAATSIAPYAVDQTLIQTLGSVASLPPTVSTSTSSNKGFFGIGASSSTSTSVTADPAASAASGLLGDLVDGFISGH